MKLKITQAWVEKHCGPDAPEEPFCPHGFMVGCPVCISGLKAKTTVVHCKREPFDVYIGRPSKWGNPFLIGKDGSRDAVIMKYRCWLNRTEQAALKASIKSELRGKRLGCFCAPYDCHGHVLAELADLE